GGGEEFTTAGGELTCIVTETAEHSTRLHSALSARARGLGPATMLVAPHDVDLFEGTIGSNITMVVGTDEQSEPDGQSRTVHTVTDEVLAAAGADELLGLVEGDDHGDVRADG